MDYSAIAVRYAKAFFSLAEEKKQLTEVKADIDLLASLASDLKLVLDNQTMKVSEKNTILTNTFEGKIHPLTLRFMNMVVENGRSTHFEGICRCLQALFRKHENLKSVRLTTAVDMSAATIQKLVAKLEKELQSKVELETQIDPSLIGGFVLRIDQEEYNASIQHRLQGALGCML
ncbi:MAG: ATP synthase F1 subunit delta [Mangrovibacterium sp.]